MSRTSSMLQIFMLIIVLSTHSSTGLSLDDTPMQQLLQNYEALVAKVSLLVEEVAVLNRSNKMLKKEVAALRSERSSNTAAVLGNSGKNEQGDRLCCSIDRMPTSCGDLKKIGHTLSGFYTVKGDSVLRSIFCDFTKPSNTSRFQIPIGYFNVKSSSVNFYVTKDALSKSGDVIVYQYAPMNVGGAMDIKTGIFTAPKTGKYYFSFSGKCRSTADSGRCWALLHKNTKEEELGRSFCDITAWGRHCTYTIQNTVNLVRGDKIFTSSVGINANLYDDNYNPSHYTHFTGFLIEEDLSSILATA